MVFAVVLKPRISPVELQPAIGILAWIADTLVTVFQPDVPLPATPAIFSGKVDLARLATKYVRRSRACARVIPLALWDREAIVLAFESTGVSDH